MKKYVYFLASVVALFLIIPAKTAAGDTNLPPLSPLVRTVTTALFLNLTLAYFLLIHRRQRLPLSAGGWLIFFLIAALFCAAFPFFGGDLMECLIRGRIFGLYHESPYRMVPADIPGDPLYPYSVWRRTPDSYGPLHVYLETLPAVLFKNSLTGMIWSYKFMTLFFAAAGSYFFYRIAREIAPQNRDGLFGAFVFNPFLFVLTAIEGKNDVMILSLLLISAYALLKDRFFVCFFFWTLAFLVKFTAALVLPFLIAAVVQRRRKPLVQDLGIFARACAGFAIVAFLSFYPVWDKATLWVFQKIATAPIYSNTLPYLFYQALLHAGVSVDVSFLKGAVSLVFIGLYFLVLYRFWIKKEFHPRSFFRALCLVHLAFYSGVATTVLLGHYLAWNLGWLILAEWPLGPLPVILYSLAGFLSYFKRINFLALLLGCIYLAAILCVRRRSLLASRGAA